MPKIFPTYGLLANIIEVLEMLRKYTKSISEEQMVTTASLKLKIFDIFCFAVQKKISEASNQIPFQI